MKIKGINFSPKYTTGSIQDRINTMQRLREDIYSGVIDAFVTSEVKNGLYMEYTQHHSVPLRKLEDLIKKSIPEPINFYLTENGPNSMYDGYVIYDGCIILKFDRNYPKIYRIELPASNKQLPIHKIPTLMHEITHLLDFSLNPQYRVTMQKLIQNGITNDAYKLYKDFYYNKKTISTKGLLKQTNKFLKDYSPEDQLLILQYIKLFMATEINAHKASHQYAETLHNLYGQKLCKADTKYYKYHFEEKTELINKMRAKIIKKERAKNNHTMLLNKLKNLLAFRKKCDT